MNCTRKKIIVILCFAGLISLVIFLFFFFFRKIPSTIIFNKALIENDFEGDSAIFPKTSENTQNDATGIMAWIYPGEPSCEASKEYSTRERIDVLKPEYFMVNETGDLVFLTEETSGCNGYSSANIADIKKYSKSQYVTISSSYAKSMDLFLKNSLSNNTNINTLVAFVVENDIVGVELDFEDFGGWSRDTYARYKDFITQLGSVLHQKGKKLMIDGPAMSKKEEEGWFPWRYEDIASLPVDHVVIMAYDYQFDYGVGSPVAPIFWMKDVMKWTKDRVPDGVGITLGIPSYGYRGIIGGSQITLLTYEQLKEEKGFETATRDTESGELTWKNGDNIYFYQDGKSMSMKRQAAENLGITSVSIWHLGGNPWFEKD